MRSGNSWMIATMAGAMLAALSASPRVQPQQGSTVAVVDNDRVFDESIPGQEAAAQIQGSISEWRQRIAGLDEELNGMIANRAEQVATLDAEALEVLDVQIEQQRVDLQRLQTDAQREVDRFRDQVLVELEQTLAPLVGELAREHGYDIILNTQTPGLLYHSDAIDITDLLIGKANTDGPQAAGSR